MTTEPSPGQGAPQDDYGWAFRPRNPAARPRPYAERQDTDPAAPWDGRPPAESHDMSSGTRWDATMPLRFPEPRTGAHEATHAPAPWTPPHSRRASETADHETGYTSPATAVLTPVTPHHPELVAAQSPVTAQSNPPAGAGAERPGKTRSAGRIALALAVLAAAGGAAAVLLEQEGTATSASEKLTQVWQIPAPAADDALIGSWLTDKLLIRASSRGGLQAYDLTDGKQAWNAANLTGSAGRGTVPCAMSPTLSAHGIGTVAFGKDGSTCTWLAAVKASTGKILWSTPLTNAKHPTAATTSTYLQGDVATIVGENFLGGVDIRTGSRVWSYKARGHYCNAYDWGTNGTVLVDDFCLDQKSRFTLTAFDGRTGKTIWRKAESAHSDVTQVLSGSPLVAAVHTARQDVVRVLGTTGTGRKLAVGDDELTTGNDSGADHSARLYGNVLVTPASASGTAVIDGFDTATGARLWTHRSAALAIPASGADDKVYAVTTSGSPQLITIDPRTGRTVPVADLPMATGRWSFTSGTVYVTPDGSVLELNALGTNGGVRLYR
ncbi:PQQ-binding-like beta-propeller repeat protein [Streptomyces fagopyri]|uniref:outer membrane protein assembly factor BamB family protein n=1 Tax=Streptomyces fagopyri TaxID=2662397 RepID=UPI0033EE20D1